MSRNPPSVDPTHFRPPGAERSIRRQKTWYGLVICRETYKYAVGNPARWIMILARAFFFFYFYFQL